MSWRGGLRYTLVVVVVVIVVVKVNGCDEVDRWVEVHTGDGGGGGGGDSGGKREWI